VRAATVETLRDFTEARITLAMRAWRIGCGWLTPWCRATPFASANHYRDRALPIPASPSTADGDALVAMLGAPHPETLWVFDLPGPLALGVAFALRRSRGVAGALVWNGWYDPDGVLAGREEIPLLLALGGQLADLPDAAMACLIFDSSRGIGASSPDRLDNRYALTDEDVPSLAQVRGAGCRRVVVLSHGDLLDDLADYVSYLRTEMPVEVVAGVALPSAA
jgi:hypothetical protein